MKSSERWFFRKSKKNLRLSFWAKMSTTVLISNILCIICHEKLHQLWEYTRSLQAASLFKKKHLTITQYTVSYVLQSSVLLIVETLEPKHDAILSQRNTINVPQTVITGFKSPICDTYEKTLNGSRISTQFSLLLEMSDHPTAPTSLAHKMVKVHFIGFGRLHVRPHSRPVSDVTAG
jgi:predicted Zn-dependent protease